MVYMNGEKMINVLIQGLDHIEDSSVIKNALADNGSVPQKIQKHVLDTCVKII